MSQYNLTKSTRIKKFIIHTDFLQISSTVRSSLILRKYFFEKSSHAKHNKRTLLDCSVEVINVSWQIKLHLNEIVKKTNSASINTIRVVARETP